MTDYTLLCSMLSISSAYRFVIRPDAVFGASPDFIAGNLFQCPVIALVSRHEQFRIVILRSGQAEASIAAEDAWLDVHARTTA
jgi:hypothetical protein